MEFYVEAYSKADGSDKALRHVGDYATLDEAIAAAKRTIDESLLREFKAGMAGDELYGKFQAYGELPCIFRGEDNTLSGLGFNALQYSRTRCTELCGK
jgi:hypothetical protein